MCGSVFVHIDALSSRFLRYSRPSQHTLAPFTGLLRGPTLGGRTTCSQQAANCAFTHTWPQDHKNGPCRPGHTLPPQATHSHTPNFFLFFSFVPFISSPLFSFYFHFFSPPSTPDLGTLGCTSGRGVPRKALHIWPLVARSELRKARRTVSQPAQAAFCMLPQSKKVVAAVCASDLRPRVPQIERHETLFQLEDFCR